MAAAPSDYSTVLLQVEKPDGKAAIAICHPTYLEAKQNAYDRDVKYKLGFNAGGAGWLQEGRKIRVYIKPVAGFTLDASASGTPFILPCRKKTKGAPDSQSYSSVLTWADGDLNVDLAIVAAYYGLIWEYTVPNGMEICIGDTVNGEPQGFQIVVIST